MNGEKTKVTNAYEKLKLLLQEGKIDSRRTIATNELAEMVGMGRAPVLEALKRLESGRHVIIIPQKGIRVREMTIQEMREINDVRIALEGFIVRTIAPDFSNEDVFHLQTLLDEMALSETEGDPKRFIKADEAFHLYLCEKCGNVLLIDIIQRLRERFFAAGLYILMRPERTKSTLDEHKIILAALRAKNAKEAEKAMILHIENGKKRLV